MQILPFEPTFGQTLGKTLGAGLEELAQGRMKQLQDRNVAKYLKSANPNMTDEQTLAVSKLPGDLRDQVMKQMGGSGLEGLAALFAETHGTGELHTNPTTNVSQAAAPTTGIQNVQSMQGQQFAPGSFQARAAALPGTTQQTPQATMQAGAAKQATLNAGAGTAQPAQPGVQPVESVQPKTTEEKIGNWVDNAKKKGLTKDQIYNAFKTIKNPQTAALAMKILEGAEKREQAAEAFEETKRHHKVQEGVQEKRANVMEGKLEETRKNTEIKKTEQALKQEERLIQENKPYLDEVENKARMADEMEKNLTTLEEALDAGDIPSPLEYKGMQFFGADIGDFMSSNAQIAIKASEALKRNMVQEFKGLGGVLEKEFESLSRSVPSLLNDKESAKKLVKLIRLQASTGKEEQAIANKYIEQGKGIPPHGLKRVVFNSPELKAVKERELLEIKRIIHNQPNGYDRKPNPKEEPIESVLETKDKKGYLVNTGTEWKSITEFKPADQKRILAKYGIIYGAKK